MFRNILEHVGDKVRSSSLEYQPYIINEMKYSTGTTSLFGKENSFLSLSILIQNVRCSLQYANEKTRPKLISFICFFHYYYYYYYYYYLFCNNFRGLFRRGALNFIRLYTSHTLVVIRIPVTR